MTLQYDKYAQIFKALSDSTRVQIFHMLAAGELCACKILEDFSIMQPTLSYHMKILTDCGLVIGRREGVWMKYSVNNDSYVALQYFINDIALNQEKLK